MSGGDGGAGREARRVACACGVRLPSGCRRNSGRVDGAGLLAGWWNPARNTAVAAKEAVVDPGKLHSPGAGAGGAASEDLTVRTHEHDGVPTP
eukprot:7388878-Prymnesium_polylepis.1